MIVRVIALGVALCFVPLVAAADEPMDQEEIVVPPPAPPPPPPPPVVIVEEEEVVAAGPPPWVEFERTSVGAGLGLSWGGGMLSFDGEDHAFTIKGLSLGELGASKMVAVGDVRNLERVSDFAGTYVSVEAGAAASKGATALTMRNEHGVTITLTSQQDGVRLRVGPEGLRIALQ